LLSRSLNVRPEVSGQGKALPAVNYFGLIPGWCHEGRFAVIYQRGKRVPPEYYT